MSRLGCSTHVRHCGNHFVAVLVWFSCALAFVSFAGTASATHRSGTLSNANPSVAWSDSQITGAYAPDESGCIEDVNCETYLLTLAPGDYTDKRIRIGIIWVNPANDFDLYVHEGSANGPIIIREQTTGAPQTSEAGLIVIDAVVMAPITYYVHVLAGIVTTPGYDGAASLAANSGRAATYLAGSLTFSQNVALKCPAAPADGEPSVRVDIRGNAYVGGIRALTPADGSDLWRFDLNPASPNFDPGMQNSTYLGQPDALVPQDPNDPAIGGADGGADMDISVSFPIHPDSTPVVTIVSLTLANISSAFSFNRGTDFTLSPATAIAPVDDRQWIESTGPDRVYLVYRLLIPAGGLFVQRSDDHGLTYPITGNVVSPSAGRLAGYIDVDQSTSGPYAGRVYVSHTSGLGSNTLVIGYSSDFGLNWNNAIVDSTTGHSSLLDVVKVGDDGTVYVTWSDAKDIYLAHSTDGGVTWSDKVRVNDNTVYKTNVFPWLEAGSAGRVAVVWYGTTSPTNDDSANWEVLFAQSTDASSPTPTFRQQVISDHLIHGSNIDLGGLLGTHNRELLDFFQVALDQQGAAVVAFTDDSNDFYGNVYVTRQLDGTSLYAGSNGGNGLVNAVYPPPLRDPDPSQPEVMDFLHDANLGLLQPIPEDNPYDVLSIDYSCEDLGTMQDPKPAIVATMKVSDLSVVPAAANWQMSFSANCPTDPTSRYGLSDRGDQFFFRANTDNAALPTFVWGTAVRGSDGALVYTDRGTADFGVIDPANDVIVTKVALSQLNPIADPDIGVGSVLYGLRGRAFTEGANAIRDYTRGGTSFTYQCSGRTPTLLSMFVAEGEAEGIRVRWQFGPTAVFSGVTLERATGEPGPWSALGVSVGTQGEVSTALDGSAEAGVTYYYRLVAIEADGRVSIFGPVAGTRGVATVVPAAAFLGTPSPNPSNGSSSVQFRVGKPGFVELAVFDPSGRRVRTLQAGNLASGIYGRTWDGRTDRFSNAPAGVYLFVLHSADGVMKSQRVALVR